MHLIPLDQDKEPTCGTSIYPTPYDKVNLRALDVMADAFPDAVLGLSDHSKGIWTCLGACARGAVVLEKHYVSDKSWPGPDVDVSIDPRELRDLNFASKAVWEASKGKEKLYLPRGTGHHRLRLLVRRLRGPYQGWRDFLDG